MSLQRGGYTGALARHGEPHCPFTFRAVRELTSAACLLQPRGWSGHQCIRHLVSAHRHSEADAVGDADSQASDVEPLEELLDRAIATGIIPDVILEFGPHTADLRVTYVSQDNNPTRVFIGVCPLWDARHS